jgi:mitochondrial-processing peptidase subunit alpha
VYPFATEEPEVTVTTARDHQVKFEASSSGARKKSYSVDDPFDDSGTMSPAQVEELRRKQREALPTRLGQGTVPIEPTVPEFVPPNVNPSLLDAPTVELTQLDNGIRVVSQETYGQVSAVGVVANLGSRYEPKSGMTQLLELMSFGDTAKYSGLQITQTLQDWGGTRFVSAGRDQSLWCLDLLRPNVDAGLELLLDQVILNPSFTEKEMEEAGQVLGFQSLDMPPEVLMSEAIQSAAYGNDQQLGRPHFAMANPDITRDDLRKFWTSYIIQNPAGLVVAGAGVSHQQLVDRAQKHLGHLKQQPLPTPLIESKYVGGRQELIHTPHSPDGLIRVAVAVPTGGWHAATDLVTTCVLQTLLGGGNSFSAGGPGKGMYSRLYREVLNRYSWAESSEAFTTFFHEQGLWGISGTTIPRKAREMTQVICGHLARLAVEPVKEEELSRARNMLKCNVLTQLESRIVLFEDLGRQVLTYGSREEIATTCQKIESVTAQDVLELAKRSLLHPVTLAAVGEDLQGLPDVSEVMEWMRPR